MFNITNDTKDYMYTIKNQTKPKKKEHIIKYK